MNAQCLLHGGSPGCSCLEGFTGDGLLCVGEYFCRTSCKMYLNQQLTKTRCCLQHIVQMNKDTTVIMLGTDH